MRDSSISACSAIRTARHPHSPAELSHVGILRLIDRLGTESLRDWLTLRCFVEAAQSGPGGVPIPDDAIARWVAHGLCDRHGTPLLPGRATFESRYLRAQCMAALTARDAASAPLHDAVATRVRRNFLFSCERPPARTAVTPEALDAALVTLTAAFRHVGALRPDAGAGLAAAPQASADLDCIDESRNPTELFDAWRAALQWTGDGPSAIPAGPVDIVSKMRRGDLRVLRDGQADIRTRLEVAFPTQPPRTLEVALRLSLARCLPTFCNPIGPVEHDALRAELRHLPACRAVLEDDDRRARLYWSAAARYAVAPAPRRGARRRFRPWRATLLRGMLLAASWSGEPRSATIPEIADPDDTPGTWISSPWVACQRWWPATAVSGAMALATPPRNTGQREADEVDDVYGRNEVDKVDEADGVDEADEVDGAGEDGVDTPGDRAAPTGAGTPPPWVSPVKSDDDDVLLLWSHVSPGVRRRIVAGARRFAGYSPVLDGSEGTRDDDAIQRLNQEGWYAYSNIPAIFFICDKLLDDRQVLDQTALHALLGDIGRAAVRDRANYVLCFEDQRNRSLAWRVDTTAAPGADVTPLAMASIDPGDASDAGAVRTPHNATAEAAPGTPGTPASLPDASPDAIRKESGNRLVLKQILALLAKTNDPPFDLDILLCTMIETKHVFDADIARHAAHSVAEIRSALRRVALARLLDINRRDFPRRRAASDDITTAGAMRFVDLLISLIDPVLQAAPDTLAYGGADVFHARFGHYFAERNAQPGVSPGRWASIVSQGREHVKGWALLTRDESYLAAMNAENPALLRHLQSLFANEIARSAWLFSTLREGPPLARSAIAKQYLLAAGIPADQPIEFRRFITLTEAQTHHGSLRDFNGTFLEIYMAIDDGLDKLREAEPRYRAILSDSALARLPSRREVIDQFDKAFDAKLKNFRQFSREAIEAGFDASEEAIKRDFAAAARLRLHLYRPLAEEKSLLAQYVGVLDEQSHRYQRNILGHSTGAIIETIGSAGHSRFYLFDVERFTIGNRTAMLTPLPWLRNARAVERYMASAPELFFAERFPSIYDEPVYYKNDVKPHLQFDCGGLGGVWEKWIDFRASHHAWRRRTLLEKISIEKLQDDPLAIYVEMLPFYTCESARQARALTLNVILDGIFCLLDIAGLRHVFRPMRTWIAHSAAAGQIEKRLTWYETLGKRSTLDAQIVSQQVDALHIARRSIEELRRRRSTKEVAIAFHKITHFPLSASASTGYRIYKVMQTVLEIRQRVQPFLDDGRESPMQRFLRWKNRNRLWEANLQGDHLLEQRSRGHETIVGALRHADEGALPYRLREATCSPNVCVSTCLFDSLASMTTHRRMRIFVKLLDGVAPHDIVRQSVRQGFLLTSAMLAELTQLTTELGPLREKFAQVRTSDFAPRPRRRALLSQALLHPYANTSANAHLLDNPSYRELANDLYVLNFFFESPLQQLAQTLDSPSGPQRSCRAPTGNGTTLETHGHTAPPDAEDAALADLPPVTSNAPHISETVTPSGRGGTCTRPGEDNEIRTCLLPIAPCADQRSLPVAPPDRNGNPGPPSG